MRKTANSFLLLLILAGTAGNLNAQWLLKYGFRLGSGGGTAGSRIASGGINDLICRDDRVWAAHGDGLSLTSDGGSSWKNFGRNNGLGKGGVSAFAVLDGVIWAATGYDTLTADAGNLPAGGGVGYSTDGGGTWHWTSQPKDSRTETRYNPTTTHIQNITYDLALVPAAADTTVWIASFGGGLRKSADRGKTWEVVTVDGAPFNPSKILSHRAFSVFYDGEALWAGTAGGVHKSMDNGRTLTTFSHRNQTRGISGNFVVAIAKQKTGGRDIVWAATVETTSESGDSTEFRAVSKSEDGGLTWSACLKGAFPHNFAFDDSAVYVAADSGLYKSLDYGETWSVFPSIRDRETDEPVYAVEANCAAVGAGHVLWDGTSDGVARTDDDGNTWRVFRAFQTPGQPGQPATYAYPNPFSPFRDNLAGDDGHVRFQYRTLRPARVTVRVYDFGMNLVRNVTADRERPVPGDYCEAWDGRNDFGEMAANGVYFYRIDVTGEGTVWGKVIVMN
jgi:hypothetical protein